jgi:hypothetical protein
VGAASTVTLRVLAALGWDDDPDRARAFLAQTMTRQLPRLSVADLREVLAAVGATAPEVPAQRGGSDVYLRDEQPDPGAGGRRHRGPGHGGLTEGGELVDETGD